MLELYFGCGKVKGTHNDVRRRKRLFVPDSARAIQQRRFPISLVSPNRPRSQFNYTVCLYALSLFWQTFGSEFASCFGS